MAYPENALTLDILPLSADTARLVRVYGTEPCIALPGTLPAGLCLPKAAGYPR